MHRNGPVRFINGITTFSFRLFWLYSTCALPYSTYENACLEEYTAIPSLSFLDPTRNVSL